jgi:hypothetical protein
MGCQCTTSDGGKRAWVRVDDPGDEDSWVHAACGQPSLATLRSQNMLNLFQGGAHHNELVETSDLTSKGEFSWVIDYSWTTEIIYGSQSGRPARVWRPKEQVSSNV